jgi:hypothetical protein
LLPRQWSSLALDKHALALVKPDKWAGTCSDIHFEARCKKNPVSFFLKKDQLVEL